MVTRVTNASMHTTKATGDISAKTFKICRIVLILVLVIFFILFSIGHILVAILFGIMRGLGKVSPQELQSYTISLFTTPMIVIVLAIITSTLLLNVS